MSKIVRAAFGGRIIPNLAPLVTVVGLTRVLFMIAHSNRRKCNIRMAIRIIFNILVVLVLQTPTAKGGCALFT